MVDRRLILDLLPTRQIEAVLARACPGALAYAPQGDHSQPHMNRRLPISLVAPMLLCWLAWGAAGPAQAQGSPELATATIVVNGMMKSRSGAT